MVLQLFGKLNSNIFCTREMRHPLMQGQGQPKRQHYYKGSTFTLYIITYVSSIGEGTQAQHEQLCAFIVDSSVGGVLQTVRGDCEEFYSFYLHDFVRSAHTCKHKNASLEDLEYKVFIKFGIIILYIIAMSLTNSGGFSSIEQCDPCSRLLCSQQ